MTDAPQQLPEITAHVFAGAAFRVVSGANVGDPLHDAAMVEPGDVYRLSGQAAPERLVMTRHPDGTQSVAVRSAVGLPGERVTLAGSLTLMAPDGENLSLLVIRLEDSGIHALPLSPLRPRVDYTLLDIQHDAGLIQVTDLICVSFAAGTLITLPGGTQKPIEHLRAGDVVLTRAHGPQPVRWIGKAAMRATGSFAPVVITAGVLGNTHDLVVSPHHRVFLYQRGERRIGATAEILVQAKHLVDGERVFIREGGFVDYYSLVFDRHEIIYAEGIPAESLMLTDATLTILPEDIASDLRAQFPGLRHSPHYGTEIGRSAIQAHGRDTLFRKP